MFGKALKRPPCLDPELNSGGKKTAWKLDQLCEDDCASTEYNSHNTIFFIALTTKMYHRAASFHYYGQ